MMGNHIMKILKAQNIAEKQDMLAVTSSHFFETEKRLKSMIWLKPYVAVGITSFKETTYNLKF